MTRLRLETPLCGISLAYGIEGFGILFILKYIWSPKVSKGKLKNLHNLKINPHANPGTDERPNVINSANIWNPPWEVELLSNNSPCLILIPTHKH